MSKGHHVTSCPPVNKAARKARFNELRGGNSRRISVRTGSVVIEPKAIGDVQSPILVPTGETVFFNIDIDGVWFGVPF